MKRLLFLLMVAFLLAACSADSQQEDAPKKEETPKQNEVEKEEPTTEDSVEDQTKEEPVKEEKSDLKTEAEANTEENPAKPGAMLYDKAEGKFKGMNYYFKGELIKIEKVEGLFGNMEDALLVKNEQGYVMPIFPPYEVSAAEGDEIEVWGPLSGDGYASSDLGVDNVVGMTGAMNASLVNVNGEMK